jgi:predicted transcriptional regulator
MSDNDALIELTAEIVSSFITNNRVATTEIAGLIKATHETLHSLGTATAQPEPAQEPAVSIRSSVKPDYIVCLEDGKKLKMLKRHLMTHYQMTPDQYRTKWNLPRDYPMVAPNYAATRKELALKIGLGRKPAPVAAPAKPARKPRVKAATTVDA